MEKDAQFVEMVVKELVENPDDVKVERSIDEMGVLITLAVNPADMGKVIGKEGRTAKAIRTLLRVLGAKNNSRVTLKIAEPEGGTGGNNYDGCNEFNSNSEMEAAPEQPAMTDEPTAPVEEDNSPENPSSII